MTAHTYGTRSMITHVISLHPPTQVPTQVHTHSAILCAHEADADADLMLISCLSHAYLMRCFETYSSQSAVAKLTASQQLKPWEKPPWYASGKVITYSPGSWLSL
jgi:hypothetical protein